MDQVFVLHEFLISHPNAISAFLDIKAAYDTVDRRVLWTELAQSFAVPLYQIRLLRSFFDYNSSRLIVNNQKSTPISNTRGLFQGSSLSPLLFNVFIDGLIRRLNDCPKVNWKGLSTNNLFFADDANVHAQDSTVAQALLQVCEDWSVSVGIEFAPSKCQVLAPPGTVVRLYNTALPIVDSADYLGIPMTRQGADLQVNTHRRTTKTKATINFMNSVGMNGWGWRPLSAITALKAFIRPKFEYGLSLHPKPAATIVRQVSQCLQNALRSAFSVGFSTSKSALQLMSRLEPMSYRIQELNARLFGKFLHSQDYSIPAVKLFHYNFASARRNKKSFLSAFKFYNDLRPLMTVPNPALAVSPSPLLRQTMLEQRLAALLQMKQSGGPIGSAISCDSLFVSPLIRHAIHYPRENVRCLTLWRLGRIAMHQTCVHCDQEVSRVHAIDCAQIAATNFTIPNWTPDDSCSLLDSVLNWIDAQSDPQPVVVSQFANAIRKIQSHSLGHRPVPLPPVPPITENAQPLLVPPPVP
jgi:hypothetical protein